MHLKAPRYPFKIIPEVFFLGGNRRPEILKFVFQKQKYLAIYDLKTLRFLSHLVHLIAYAIILIF